MGKAAIYNPYLDTLGGGERYTLSFAKVLVEEGYDVDFEWDDKGFGEKVKNRFGFNLSKKINFIKSINRGENYNVCFWVSDGSIPTLRARKNYIHFQVPFMNVNGKSLLNKMKLFRINKVICNSNFTKEIVDKEYGINSIVLYPPVDIDAFKPKRKENTICYVGRFSDLVQSKRDDILIESFKKLVVNKKFASWKLILAGGVEVGVGDNLLKLKKKAIGYNIEFVESPSFNDLKNIYGKSKIFWSATGFNVDQEKNPEKTEHFGITLIESMASGRVPIVYSSGGYREIIDSGKNGFLWQNRKDLVGLTNQLINKAGRFKEMSKKAKESVFRYSLNEFRKNICKIL